MSESNPDSPEGLAPYSDYSDLFDMSTVANYRFERKKKIRKEIVTFPKLAFESTGSMRIVEDHMISFFEVDESMDPLESAPHKPLLVHSKSEGHIPRLNYSRGCGRDTRDTDHFVMPSLRLDYVDDHEYQEPIRNRDKDWVLDSQREILNKEPGNESVELLLGQYRKPTKYPPLMWSPLLQTTLRKRRLLRTAAVISDTHCFVDIYGLGVAGRVLAPGGPTNRLLLVEAYSVWDSTMYSITIHIPHLKRLLLGKEHLFVPGKKLQLLRELVHLLFFDYTIEYKTLTSQEDVGRVSPDTSQEESGDDLGDAQQPTITEDVAVNGQESELSASIGRKVTFADGNGDVMVDGDNAVSTGNALSNSSPDEASNDRNESEICQAGDEDDSYVHHTLRVSHLDKFKLPENYPQNIADIIRALTLEDNLLDTLRPKLTQTLRISPVVRENGPTLRRRDAVEKYRLEQEEIERKKKAWLAIPLRKKGWLSGKCVRRHGKILVMMCYRMPTRPSVLNIKGHAAFECAKLTHNLDLGSLGQQYGVKLSPKLWGDDIAKFVGVKAALQLSAGEMRSIRNALFITYPGRAGSDTQLCPLPSCQGFEFRRSVSAVRRNYFTAENGYVPDVPLYEEPIAWTRNVSAIADVSSRRDRLWSGDPLTGRCKPRRAVGRPQQIITRVKKIGHVYGVCTFYLVSKLSNEELPTVQEMEASIANKDYGSQILPGTIGPDLKILIEIYFPENPTVVALRKGEALGYGGEVKNSPKVVKLELTRGDICRLVDDKSILRVAFRLGHKDFATEASHEEVEEVEKTWIHVALCVLNKLKWRKPSQGRYSLDRYTADVERAADALSMDFVDVTDILIGRDKAKMKTPSLKMAVLKKDKLAPPPTDYYAHLSALPAHRKLANHEEVDWPTLELCLSFPTVIFSKTCQVMSEVESRLDVNLQVIVWQQGLNMGVVCFDRRERDVYFMNPSDAQKELLAEQAQSSSPTEISINLAMFASALVYKEEKLPSGQVSRSVHFGDIEDEPDNPDFINDDFGDQAIVASKSAAEAVKSRQRAGVGARGDEDGKESNNIADENVEDSDAIAFDDLSDIDDLL